eukprot:s1950_g2.t1
MWFTWLRGARLEVVCLELKERLSDPEILRTQFLCHRAKFAAPLLGFSRRTHSTPVEHISEGERTESCTRLFYAKPWQTLNTSETSLRSFQRLHVAHGAATAIWNLHSLGATFGRWEDGVGLAADGKVELLGVGLGGVGTSEDLHGLAGLLLKLLSGNQEIPNPWNPHEDHIGSNLQQHDLLRWEANEKGTLEKYCSLLAVEMPDRLQRKERRRCALDFLDGPRYSKIPGPAGLCAR